MLPAEEVPVWSFRVGEIDGERHARNAPMRSTAWDSSLCDLGAVPRQPHLDLPDDVVDGG
jgi:hypothetical protein